MVLNTRYEITALKYEENRLKNNRNQLTKKEGRLMDILDREYGGVKTDLGVVTVNYQKTEKLDVDDSAATVDWLKSNGHDDCFHIPEPEEVNKTETKQLINAGPRVLGVAVSESRFCSLK